MSAQAEFNWDPDPLDEVSEDAPQEECTASASTVERIKKLLRLARDKAATKAEAERAMAMAFDLAERHHVDVAALNLEDGGEPLLGEDFKCGRDRFTRAICGLVRDFFHVEVCFQYKAVLFVGRATDVQIAGYVFHFLLRAGRMQLKDYQAAETRQRRKNTPLKRTNFLAGFAWGLRDKLNGSRVNFQLTDQQSALVLAEKGAREEKIAELVPEMITLKAPKKMRIVQSAAMRGFIRGQETEIHRPLGNPDQLRLK